MLEPHCHYHASFSLSLKLQRNYIPGRNAFFSRNDRNSPERPVQTKIVRYLKRNEIRVYRYQIVHLYEKLLLYWLVRNDIDFLGWNTDTGRILEWNRIVGLTIPKRKIPTGTERYLKHWSYTVFEEIYRIRRKMTKREMGLFWFFFFFFLINFLFWFGFGLCCTCDTKEDGRRKSWSGFYKEGEGVSRRNSY